MSKNVSVAIDGGIARIKIDDGKVNAMSAALMAEIGEAMNEAEAAGAVVVLAGRPGMFSAGFDLKTFARGPDETVKMLRGGADLMVRLLSFPFPVLTVCEGHGYPMGAFLMLSADVRFAISGDWLIGLNEVAIGLTLPHFALELAKHRLTPPGFARATTGALFPPEEALRLGYVDRVIAPADLEDAVDGEAARLCSLDFAAHAATKERVHGHAIKAIREALEAEFPS